MEIIVKVAMVYTIGNEKVEHYIVRDKNKFIVIKDNGHHSEELMSVPIHRYVHDDYDYCIFMNEFQFFILAVCNMQILPSFKNFIVDNFKKYLKDNRIFIHDDMDKGCIV